ncbi:cysteine protease [Tritrichomonas foetus]|uniref:Cysteine protease n=1 Tax=Tritrichomonas foetus TaxID=1144522 RepID=A0A1J4KT26_9EUKA|nr:cysteine protease [Tritrichomonas foetus]|eukprot:OHT12814.1 cysteine protease [Tritrichomonas foetus]
MRQLRAFDELELIDRQQYQSKEDQPEKQQEENDQKENAQKDSKEEVEVEVEGKQNEQDKKEDNIPKETKKKQNQNQNPFRNIYYYEGKSRYDGHNYVEEHRERLTDSEGKVHVTQRRRLGDRWYENESITDEEGKTLTKESWHNVPEDQIENFKLEWGKHHIGCPEA